MKNWDKNLNNYVSDDKAFIFDLDLNEKYEVMMLNMLFIVIKIMDLHLVIIMIYIWEIIFVLIKNVDIIIMLIILFINILLILIINL